jgi:C-terminal processing protease CtpA/Prc
MMHLFLSVLLMMGAEGAEGDIPEAKEITNPRVFECFWDTTCSLEIKDTSSTTQGYLRDLDTLKVWIETLHPQPFARISEEIWDATCEKTKKDVTEGENELAMTLAVGTMLGVLKDSHTMISLVDWTTNEMDGLQVNTLTFSSIDGDVYVKHDEQGLIAPGTKITTIHGLPIADIFDNAKMISPQEGEAWLSRVRIAEHIILPMARTMVSAMGTDSGRGTTINGLNYPFGEKLEISNWKENRRDKRDTGLIWEFDDGVARLEIGSFMSGSGWRYFRELNRGFKQIEKHGEEWGIKGLVVDLRGNLGGVSYRMGDVFYYLTDEEIKVPVAHIKRQSKESVKLNRDRYRGMVKWIVDRWGNEGNGLVEIKRRAELEIGEVDTIRYDGMKLDMGNVFSGPVVVLIDGLSSSASVSFVAEFNRLERGMVLGEPCNGPNTGTFSDAVERSLPESGLKVMISTGRFVMDDEYAFRSRPIKPTRWVQWSKKDLAENRDPLNNAVQDWVHNTEVGNLKQLSDRESKVLWEELETVFSRDRFWGGLVREEVWTIVLEGDDCVQEAKTAGKNYKQCKTSRNVLITLSLPQELRKIFEQLISPSRPAVLHFGIHNRMDCNVCKPS